MSKRTVAYKPFEDSETLDFFDEDFRCIERYPNSIDNLNLEDIEVAAEMLEDSISDYDTIIEIQRNEAKRAFALGKKYDTSSLKTDRQRRQQLVVELRAIKERVKMMKNENVKELAVA